MPLIDIHQQFLSETELRIQNLNFMIQVSEQFEVIHVNESYLPVHMLLLFLF